MKRKMNPISYFWIASLILTAFVSNAIAARNKENQERSVRWSAVAGERQVTRGYRIDGSPRFKQGTDKAIWSIKKEGPWWPIWTVNIVDEVQSSGIKGSTHSGGSCKRPLEAKTAIGAWPKASAVDLSRPNLNNRADGGLTKDVRSRIQTRLNRELELAHVKRDRKVERDTITSFRSGRHVDSLLARTTRRESARIILPVERNPSAREVRYSRERLALNPANREPVRGEARI